uniref:Uncharacterized protein n=1 Tax=Arundo donax TaxID=35708 RepID=A0A0A9CP06_ARUDO
MTPDQKRFAKMEQQVVEIVKTLAAMQISNSTLIKSMEENTQAVRDLSGWKPEMMKTVDEIQGEMGKLQQKVSLISRNPILMVKPSDIPWPPLIPTPPPISVPPSLNLVPPSPIPVPPSSSQVPLPLILAPSQTPTPPGV